MRKTKMHRIKDSISTQKNPLKIEIVPKIDI